MNVAAIINYEGEFPIDSEVWVNVLDVESLMTLSQSACSLYVVLLALSYDSSRHLFSIAIMNAERYVSLKSQKGKERNTWGSNKLCVEASFALSLCLLFLFNSVLPNIF